MKSTYQGVRLIAGVDEAGRGPLAGPVVAAACVFREDYNNSKIKDSKQLSARTREKLWESILHEAVSYSVVAVGPRRIERINIREATKLAMSLAVRRVNADLVLIDGNMPINTDLPQETVVGGDRTIVQISAASILAKVWRDRLMCSLARKYPHYGFEKHAGYGTVEHRAAIGKYGPSKVHRYTFSGVKEYKREQGSFLWSATSIHRNQG